MTLVHLRVSPDALTPLKLVKYLTMFNKKSFLRFSLFVELLRPERKVTSVKKVVKPFHVNARKFSLSEDGQEGHICYVITTMNYE